MTDLPLIDRASFFSWAEGQRRGRFERVNGRVVAMSPERWNHARLKAAIWRALDDQVRSIPRCAVAPDGMTISVGDDTDFEPDVSVHLGEPIPADSLVVPNPVIAIEVVSPSSTRVDTVIKREGYFRVPSIAHYLVFRADRREVLHWTREADPPVRRASGQFVLTPPGLVLDLDAIYERAETS